MEDNKRKILLISLCTIGMMAFVYFEFIAKESGGQDMDGFVNPAAWDESESKRDIYAEKRRKERKDFSYNRKVASLENFLENQVEKDPFEDSVQQLNMETTKGTEKPQSAQKSIKKEITAEGTEEALRSDKGNGEIVENEEGKQPPESPLPSRQAGFFKGEFEDDNRKPRKAGFASGGNERINAEAEENEEIEQNDINVLAVVHESLELKNGSNIKLRIPEAFSVGGYAVPKNTFVIGNVRFIGDHIYIDVKYISINGQLLAVDLTAYDMNGSMGLYVEGGVDKEIRGDALEKTVNEVQKNVDVPILRSVPFTSAKKKIREDMVPIEAGYKLYLRSNRPPPAPPR